MSAIFYQIFIFSPNDSHLKTMKNVFYFILNALFIFEIFNFLYFHLPLFFSLSAIALEVDSRKIYDIIICLNKNMFCLISWARNKVWHWHFIHWWHVKYGTFLCKNHAENVHQKLAPDPLLILLNNSKETLHAGNSFENKKFWKMII